MLPALHYTHFCLLLIFKCSVERLPTIPFYITTIRLFCKCRSVLPLSPLQKPLCHKEAGERGKKKVGGYHGKMPFPSFHCHLVACYAQALPHRHTSWDTQKISNQIKPPKEIPVSKILNPLKPFNRLHQLKSGVTLPPPPHTGFRFRKKQDGNQQQATEYLPKCKRHTGKFVTHITKENCNKKMSFKNSS